jgi:hypothetical protein
MVELSFDSARFGCAQHKQGPDFSSMVELPFDSPQGPDFSSMVELPFDSARFGCAQHKQGPVFSSMVELPFDSARFGCAQHKQGPINLSGGVALLRGVASATGLLGRPPRNWSVSTAQPPL